MSTRHFFDPMDDLWREAAELIGYSTLNPLANPIPGFLDAKAIQSCNCFPRTSLPYEQVC